MAGTSRATVGDAEVVRLEEPPSGLTSRSPNGVLLKSVLENTAKVWVGFTDDIDGTAEYELDPGDHITIPVPDPSQLFLIAGDADQEVVAMWL